MARVKRYAFILFLILIIGLNRLAGQSDSGDTISVDLFKALSKDEKVLCFPDALEQFYRIRGNQMVWNDMIIVLSFIQELEDSKEEGLNPLDYHLKDISDLTKVNHANAYENRVKRDLLLSDAFLLYADHLLNGKVDPHEIFSKWDIDRNYSNPLLVLTTAFEENNPLKAINDIKPSGMDYQQLKAALKKYRNIQNMGGWDSIASEKNISMGMEDTRIPQIIRRLNIDNDSAKDWKTESKIYDSILKQSVIHFQKRHGLDPNGIVDNNTLDAMNVSIESRINQIIANMERLRWYPPINDSLQIKVNIPDYTLKVYRNGTCIREYKVIVGRPSRPSPMLSSKINLLIFNPSWTIPPGILKADILPEVRKDTAYLKKKNIIVYNINGIRVDLSAVDWNSAVAKTYKYRQPPGIDNALGAVKFLFSNEFNVYLHDTPSKDLFDQPTRAFSSGCIRVQDALMLAEYLLNDSVKWNSKKISETISEGKTFPVRIKKQPKLLIHYSTAWVDDQNSIHFRDDIYNLDYKINQALKEKAKK